jgi:ferric-dicitrate binding protein FerR (iron transport regulator)
MKKKRILTGTFFLEMCLISKIENVIRKDVRNMNKHIGLHIVEYLIGGENDFINDPVLTEWLAADESNRADFMKYKKIWKESRYFTEMESFDSELAWKKVNEINRRKERIRKRFTHIGYAASGVAATLLLFITLSYMGFMQKDTPVDLSMTAGYGSRSEIVLPDGSLVKLNAGSSIRYAFDPEKNIRELHFQGEGFFDVAKSENPFVVNMANGVQIKLLGTTFNLCAYEDDPTLQASLVEGNIELSHASGKLHLDAGEMAVYDRQTHELKKENGIPAHTYGWIDHKIYLNHMSLSEVCKKLERCYDVKITLHGNFGETIHYDGVLQEENISDVMEALRRVSKMKYQVNGKNIHITSQ